VAPAEWNGQEPGNVVLDLELPTRGMATLLEGTGAHVVDLLPEFRGHYSADLYFRTDPHWAPAGHTLAARVLQPVVEEALRTRSPRADDQGVRPAVEP
jgi:hypothetical protein